MKKALAVAVILSATTSLAEGWGPRASAFQAKQAAERKRLGLDSEKAAKQFPTPEVRFGGGTSWVCPGQPSPILLEGKLVPGTLVGTFTEGVEITKEELTPKGWQATINVKPGTKESVTLQLIAPLSGITGSIELPVGCPREWVIDLKNADRLVLKVIDGQTYAPGEWFRGNKSVETRGFSLTSDGKGFTLVQNQNADDREREKKAEGLVKGGNLAERQQALSEKMQGCTSMPAQQMGPCIQKYSAELQELMSAQTNAVQAAQAAAAPKVGCQQFQGSISGKTLSGNGMQCAVKDPYAKLTFTGSIR